MDLVDEEDVVGLQVGEDGGQVAGAFQRGSRGDTEIDALLRGDDSGQGGLAQSGRAGEQHVVERPLFCDRRVQGDLETLFYRVLADELAEMTRSESYLVVIFNSGAEEAFFPAHPLANLCSAVLI
jgi:hypothetical protein